MKISATRICVSILLGSVFALAGCQREPANSSPPAISPPPASNTTQSPAKQDEKQTPEVTEGQTETSTSENETKSTEKTPAEVAKECFQAMAKGDKETVKKLMVANPADTEAEFLLEMISPDNKDLPEMFGNFSAVEGVAYDELALVVKTDVGPRFTDELDTDPMFLRKVDGEWKVYMCELEVVLAGLETDELKSDFQKAMDWYKNEEAGVREKILKDKDKKND